MVVASVRASPRMAWMSLARLRMDAETHWGSIVSPLGLPSGECARESKIEWPVALAREVAA